MRRIASLMLVSALMVLGARAGQAQDPAVTHWAENIGLTTLRLILVELKEAH